MSGRKNHHIPQLLQREFGTRKSKSVQVWVYSKAKPPFLTSTGNYGAERDFYIEGEDGLVDELITEFEGEISAFLQDMRHGNQHALDNRAMIASILAHLEMRSKFLREEILFRSTEFFGDIKYLLSKPQNMVLFLKNAVANNPELLSYPQILDDMGLSSEQRVLAQAWLDTNFDPFSEKNVTQFVDISQPYLENLINHLRELIKHAQLKALRSDVHNLSRRDAYLGLSYQVVHFDKPHLILPDTAVVFLKRNQGVTPLLSKGDYVNELYLPLSSQTALHGHRGSPISREIGTLNRLLASCAAKNFIAQENIEEIRALTSRIGRNAQMVSRVEMRKIIRDSIGAEQPPAKSR